MMDKTGDETVDAYRVVIDAIITQKLTPSQKVSENIISDMFGFSRAISRNLIERLIAKQFLVSVSPRVTQVAPLTLLDIKQNFMLRKMLLPEVIFLAAANTDFDGVLRITEEIHELLPVKDEESALAFLQHNKRLNLQLCEKAGFPLMLDWINQLEDTAMRIYWLYVKTNKSFPYAAEQQSAIYPIIKSGDPTRIKAIIHDMISQSEDKVMTTVFSNPQFTTQDLKLQGY